MSTFLYGNNIISAPLHKRISEEKHGSLSKGMKMDFKSDSGQCPIAFYRKLALICHTIYKPYGGQSESIMQWEQCNMQCSWVKVAEIIPSFRLQRRRAETHSRQFDTTVFGFTGAMTWVPGTSIRRECENGCMRISALHQAVLNGG